MAEQIILSGPAQTSRTFEDWWDIQGEWVEPPNLRRDGESGMQRLQLGDLTQSALYCKRQVGHLYRSLAHPFGRPTALREQHALAAFQRLGVRVPEVVYCETRQQAGQWRALLVTAELEGFVSLEDWYRDGLDTHYGVAIHRRMLAAVGTTLSRIHRARWQHSCCYPKHIFLKVQGSDDTTSIEVALLDLEKSRRRLRRSAAARHDLSQLSRHRQEMPAEDWQRLLAAHVASSQADSHTI